MTPGLAFILLPLADNPGLALGVGRNIDVALPTSADWPIGGVGADGAIPARIGFTSGSFGITDSTRSPRGVWTLVDVAGVASADVRVVGVDASSVSAAVVFVSGAIFVY